MDLSALDPKRQSPIERCLPAQMERAGRQSCVCSIDALVTAGIIPTVTCTAMLSVQIRRAAPTLFWAACRFTKQSTARHGTKEKRPRVDETRSPEQRNLHGQPTTSHDTSKLKMSFDPSGSSEAQSNRQRPQTTGPVLQFSRSETTFLTRIRSSFFTGVRGVVDLHERSGSSVHSRPTSYGPYLHHSKKWVSSFSLYWGAQGLGES